MPEECEDRIYSFTDLNTHLGRGVRGARRATGPMNPDISIYVKHKQYKSKLGKKAPTLNGGVFLRTPKNDGRALLMK